MRPSCIGALLWVAVGCTEYPMPLPAPEATLPAPWAWPAAREMIPERTVAPKPAVPPISRKAIGIASEPVISAAVSAKTDYGGNRTPASSSLLAGVWLHDAGRFVPLARGGTLALLDLPRRRMIRAETSLRERHCDYEVGLDRVAWVSTDPDPAVQAKVSAELPSDASKTPPNVYDGKSVSMGFAGDSIRIDLVWDDELGTERIVVLGADGTVTRPRPGPALTGTWIDVLEEGGRFDAAAPEGYELAGLSLRVPGRADPIVLDRDYGHVFATKAPDAPVFVMQRRFDVNDSGGRSEPIHDATVARVDLAAGATERVAHGDGEGWVVVGPDDAVYIETGGMTQRWATVDAVTPEPTIPGLHLAMPVDSPNCMCCG